jgi:4'-phosphopantetheinyl transferase EntD
MLFRQLLPASVAIAQMDPRLADPACLHPLEREQITNAVESRRREYAAGRLLARSLLGATGSADVALTNGPDRAPIWPPHVVGSITHCPSLCAVAIARSSDLFGIGIDVEPAEPLPEDVADRVLSPAERKSIARLPRQLRTVAARLVFSAKEATYKALYPTTRRFLDFPDLHVELDTNGEFTVNGTAAFVIPKEQIRGSYSIDREHLATVVVMEGGHD